MIEEEKKDFEEVAQTETEVSREKLGPETEAEKKDKKIKNLISVVILLSGLFVGSLFVDIIQLVKGGGFSQRALESTDVFSSAGKTWVAYSQPIVKIQVVTDDTCGEACKPDEVLVGLKDALPTMANEKIDVKSAQGKKLVAEFGLKTLPAFIFSKEIEKTDLFAKAEPFLDKREGGYAIKSAEAGFPIGKYITAPEISANDIKFGSDDASVKVVAFVDFQNPTDKLAYQSVLAPLAKDFEGRVQLALKAYVPPTSKQGVSAALAAACANEQGKFFPYADKLFATQTAWGKMKDATLLLKSYGAQLKLNTGDFNKCFDEKKYQELLTQTLTTGQDFGIQATPTIFVGSELQAAGVTYDNVKKTLEEQLNK